MLYECFALMCSFNLPELKLSLIISLHSIYYNFISMNVSYVTQGLTPQAEAEAEDSTYFRDLLPPGHEIHSFGKQQGKMYLTRCKASARHDSNSTRRLPRWKTSGSCVPACIG